MSFDWIATKKLKVLESEDQKYFLPSEGIPVLIELNTGLKDCFVAHIVYSGGAAFHSANPNGDYVEVAIADVACWQYINVQCKYKREIIEY
jgi:hypothetical protein